MRVQGIKEDGVWRVFFFEDAEPQFTKDNRADNGTLIHVGLKDNHHVPIYVDYAMSRFSMANAIKSAQQIESCPMCTEMDGGIADVHSINTQDEIPMVSNYNRIEPPQQQAQVQQAQVDPMFALVKKITYDAFLTKAGKMAWAHKFGNPELIEELMPKTTSDSFEMVADLLDMMSGRVPATKSRDEIYEFADNLRDTVAKAKAGDTSAKKGAKYSSKGGASVILS